MKVLVVDSDGDFWRFQVDGRATWADRDESVRWATGGARMVVWGTTWKDTYDALDVGRRRYARSVAVVRTRVGYQASAGRTVLVGEGGHFLVSDDDEPLPCMACGRTWCVGTCCV